MARSGVSNLSRVRATKKEDFGGEGHIVNLRLCWGPQHQCFSNYFIPNSYELLHNKVHANSDYRLHVL